MTAPREVVCPACQLVLAQEVLAGLWVIRHARGMWVVRGEIERAVCPSRRCPSRRKEGKTA